MGNSCMTEVSVETLSEASARGDIRAIKKISKKIDVDTVDENGWTAVQMAAWSNQTKTIQFLAACGADLAKPMSNLSNPAFIAAQRNSLESLTFLSHHVPESLRCTNKNGATVAHIAAEYDNIEILEFLAKNGFKDLLHLPKNDGSTPALIAAYFNAAKSLSFLSDEHVDLEQCDHTGKDAVFYAEMKGYDDIINIIKNNRVNIDDSEMLPGKESPTKTQHIIRPSYCISKHGHSPICTSAIAMDEDDEISSIDNEVKAG